MQNPKETVSQEVTQQQETQQQNNDNKLLSPKASVLIQSRASGTRTQGNLPKIQAEPDSLTRLRAQTQGILHEDRIINTLLQMKNSGLPKTARAHAPRT